MALPRLPFADLAEDKDEPLLLREGVSDFRPRRASGWRTLRPR